MKLVRWHRPVRWQTLAAGILLVVMAAAAGWSSWEIAESTGRTVRARNAVAALEQASSAVHTHEDLRRRYAPGQRDVMHTAVQVPTATFAQALREARPLLPDSERNDTDSAASLHERYTVAAERYFAAMDDNQYDPAVAAAVQSEANAQEINRLLTQTLVRQRRLVAGSASPAGLRLLRALATVAGAAGLGLVFGATRLGQRSNGSRPRLDPVTGLHGHRRFHEVLTAEAARCAERGVPLSCARLDLDDFREINQVHGHVEGDSLLARLGQELRASPTGRLTFRTAGDEFAVILPGQEAKQARATLDRLRLALKGRLPEMQFSAGLATIGAEGGDAILVAAQAEAALAEAKRQGKHLILSYDDVPNMPSQVIPIAKSDGLRRVIAERGVTAVFQPILRADPAGVLAYEALSRPDPRYGLAHAGEMFDVAERLGLSTELDDVCRTAIFAKAAELPRDALLFINISPKVLDRGLLNPVALTRTVQAAGLRPDRIVLEVTERAVDRLPVLVREARALRDHGFKLALDDVGAGNAGLEMLRRLPVDFVKIDREVVTSALTNSTARAVFAAITAFARESRSSIVAEGIETEDALEFVLRGGADAIQGFLLAMPAPMFTLPTEAALHMLRRGQAPASPLRLLRQAV